MNCPGALLQCGRFCFSFTQAKMMGLNVVVPRCFFSDKLGLSQQGEGCSYIL